MAQKNMIKEKETEIQINQESFDQDQSSKARKNTKRISLLSHLGEILQSREIKWAPIWDAISKGLTNFIALSGLIISVITLTFVAYNSYMTNLNIKFVEKSILKDLPADFEVKFRRVNASEEITIQNVSRVIAQDITIVVKIYYVDSGGLVLSNFMLEERLKNDVTALQKLQKANILRNPADLSFSLGKKRTLFVGEIEAEGTRFFDDFFSSTIDNAYRISNVLKTELIARVRIDYRIKETLKKQTNYKYVWIHETIDNEYQPSADSEIIREDLSYVIGGKSVIASIQNFEDSAKEVLFYEESNQ